MTACACKTSEIWTQTQGECHVTMEADIGVMLPQAKQRQGLPATSTRQERDKEQILPLSPHEGTLP